MDILLNKISNLINLYLAWQLIICQLNDGIQARRGGEIVRVNVSHLSPKQYSIKWLSKNEGTMDRLQRKGSSEVSFICTENSDTVSCLNPSDKTSICVENSSNKSATNKQSVAQIIAIVYRKLDEVGKSGTSTFFLTAPPQVTFMKPTTTDSCHPCGEATGDVTQPTPSPPQSCGHIPVSVNHRQHSAVKCVPFEFEQNNVQYLCMAKEFREPQRVTVALQQLANDRADFVLSVPTDKIDNLIRNRRCRTHIKHIKAFHRQKKNIYIS